MIYVVVGVLAVIATFLGFELEVLRGNISHLRDGREPTAGAAIFPSFPAVPIA